MPQATLTDHDPVTQATEWCVRDSVHAAYEDMADHVMRFHECEALMFWAADESVPTHVADDYREANA
jgi:hypothetical protein